MKKIQKKTSYLRSHQCVSLRKNPQKAIAFIDVLYASLRKKNSKKKKILAFVNDPI